MKLWGYLLVVGLVGLSAVGCSSSRAETKVVEVKAVNSTFAPKELTVDKGTPVKIVFDNTDVQLHDVSIDKIAVSGAKGHDGGGHDMGGKDPDVHVSADAGRTGEVVFTPTESGRYEFYCTVPGHKEAGMTGTLIVK